RDATVTGVQTCALPICSWEYRKYSFWPSIFRMAASRFFRYVCIPPYREGLVKTLASSPMRIGLLRAAGSSVGGLGILSTRFESQIGRASCRDRVYNIRV